MLSLLQRTLALLIAEALGAKHVDLGLTDSCAESGLKAMEVDWAGWAGTERSGWRWPPDPQKGHVGPPRSNQNGSSARVVL